MCISIASPMDLKDNSLICFPSFFNTFICPLIDTSAFPCQMFSLHQEDPQIYERSAAHVPSGDFNKNPSKIQLQPQK